MRVCARCGRAVTDPDREWVELPMGFRFYLCRDHLDKIAGGEARLFVNRRHEPVYVQNYVLRAAEPRRGLVRFER